MLVVDSGRFRMQSSVQKKFEKCLSLMEYAISATEEEQPKTRVFGSFDPIRDLTFRLQEKLANEQLFFVFDSSSSNSNKLFEDNAEDPRIRYSVLVTELLNKFHHDILAEIKSNEKNTPLLSGKQLTLVASVLEFYVATSIAPFLDKGVGNEIESRSKLVKKWLLIDCDRKIKYERLFSSVRILRRLAQATPELMSTIMPKFLSDFICANEQLINMEKYDGKEEYEEFIKEDVARPVLMYELFCILNRSKGSHKRPKTPHWFQLAIGHRLSELIVEPNGLYYLTTALTQDGTDMFANYTFIERLATVISVRPMFLQDQGRRRSLYYGNILKQFLFVMQSHPMAEIVADWFSATVHKIYKYVPRAVDVCIFDSIFHPWELLMSSLLPVDINELCWSQRLDMSLKTILLYLKGLPPVTGILCFNRLLKIFPLWLRFYGHLQLTSQNKSDNVVNVKPVIVADLETILLKILEDPGFTSVDKKAEFISGQIETKWFKAFKGVSVEFKEKPKVSEVITKTSAESSDNYTIRYDNIVMVYCTDELEEVNWLDDVVTGITSLLQALDKSQSQKVLTSVFTNCLCKWQKRDVVDKKSHEFSWFLNETFELDSADDSNSNMRLQYLMGHLGELLINLDFNSIDVLIPMLNVAKVLLESFHLNVKKLVGKQSFDVTLSTEDEIDKSIKEQQLKTAELAIALISGSLLVASPNEQFSDSLANVAITIKTLCNAIETLRDCSRRKFEGILCSGKQLLDVLTTVGVGADTGCNIIKTDADYECAKENTGENLLDEVYRDLADPMEPVRGHALILLARLVRKRDSAISAIENDPEIMRKITEQIISSDSYVYMAAINAMAELAYWKQHYFDMVVELFLKPVSTLRKIAEENPEFSFTESEKKDFLVVQRVKIGEALAKVCRTLGDMAAWHFERLIDPLLYMVKHTCDRQLKASSLCALGDLILACKGRGFHSVLNEILSMIEQFLTGGSEPLLRRASLTLLRSIITSFDSEMLTGMSTQLSGVHRYLRRLLLADEDEGVRLLAELCLIDIKEQLNKSFINVNEVGIRKIRIT